jgi:putative aldouronate transport system permease protein
MKMYISTSRKAFLIFNYLFLILTTLICLLPLVNVLAVSFSSREAAAGGFVKLWPVHFTLKSYIYVLHKPEFFKAFLVSIERVGLGVLINMFLTVMAAYPLSKDKKALRIRGVYAWFFLITILVGGGLIPWYMTIRAVGILDSIWALVLPGAIPVFNVILLMNFFRQLPKEIEESAFIDGAGHWITLWKIFIPLSMPSIATLILFSTVGHWNSWFDGLILMNRPEHYPLQSYLQTIVTVLDSKFLGSSSMEDIKMLRQVSDKTAKAAQVFLAALPILCVYPFLQRYFMSGIVLGSVKG